MHTYIHTLQSSWNLTSQSVDSGERHLQRGRNKQYLKGIPLDEEESGEDGIGNDKEGDARPTSISVPTKKSGGLLSPLQFAEDGGGGGSKEEEEEDDSGGIWRSVTTPPCRRSANDISADSDFRINPGGPSPGPGGSGKSSNSSSSRVKSTSKLERSSRL